MQGIFYTSHALCREGRYVPDVMQFGVPDLWSPIDLNLPSEQRRGDCEDYALGFMLWCANEGVLYGSMRMLIGLKRRVRASLKAPIRWDGHAIVWIATTQGNWISDIEASAPFKAGPIWNKPWLGSAYRLFRPQRR